MLISTRQSPTKTAGRALPRTLTAARSPKCCRRSKVSPRMDSTGAGNVVDIFAGRGWHSVRFELNPIHSCWVPIDIDSGMLSSTGCIPGIWAAAVARASIPSVTIVGTPTGLVITAVGTLSTILFIFSFRSCALGGRGSGSWRGFMVSGCGKWFVQLTSKKYQYKRKEHLSIGKYNEHEWLQSLVSLRLDYIGRK